jgi:hypothetical protein
MPSHNVSGQLVEEAVGYLTGATEVEETPGLFDDPDEQ